MDNPVIENYNGRRRDEHLDVESFFPVADAQRKILEWQRDYNETQPHGSLGNIFPAGVRGAVEIKPGRMRRPETGCDTPDR